MAPHQARELIRRLRAAYPDSKWDNETEALYMRMLSDLRYEDVDPVVDELIATMMRLPTISRIRRAVIEPTLDFPTTEEAWIAIQTREKDVHELVKRTAALLGGTFNIRTSEDPELTRVRFAKVYDDLHRKAVDEALVEGVRAQRMKLARAS
jgi:hypothetical protein